MEQHRWMPSWALSDEPLQIVLLLWQTWCENEQLSANRGNGAGWEVSSVHVLPELIQQLGHFSLIEVDHIQHPADTQQLLLSFYVPRQHSLMEAHNLTISRVLTAGLQETSAPSLCCRCAGTSDCVEPVAALLLWWWNKASFRAELLPPFVWTASAPEPDTLSRNKCFSPLLRRKYFQIQTV